MQYIIQVILASSILIVLVITLSVYLKHKFTENRLELVEKEKVNYESIIDQANDAMFVIDIVDGRVHQCNPSAAALLGYTKKELERKTLFELQPTHLLDKSSSTIADVWEKKGLIFKDIPFIKKNGELLPVECSAKVAPFAGRPSVVIYARDITERIKLENEILEQNKIIEHKNRDITDSIEYSKRIQRSFFIEKERLKNYAPESFIFFRPKDIVSGDFYWFTQVNTTITQTNEKGIVEKLPRVYLLVAAVDCTGHGVPGAFMSLIGNSLINQAVKNPEITSADAVLNYMNTEIKQSLKQLQGDTPIRDGMDVAFCVIDFENLHLGFSGANNPVYIVRDKSIIELKGDKQAVTAAADSPIRPFQNQNIELQKGDTIYLFSDGYADQFGGPLGKKFMYKRLKELFVSVQNLPMQQQEEELAEAFYSWKGDLEQVDDVLVIGIKV